MVFGIVQRHHADVEIDSAPMQGTRMRLVFDTPAPEIGTGVVRYEPATRVAMRLRLLLIDDDPVLMHSLRDTLEADGHVTVPAGGGKEGLSLFHASLQEGERFDAVVTDLGMPAMDGRKVAAAIKAASADTPVILLTGWGERLIAEADLPHGVDRVLPKPPKLRVLREAFAQLCGRAGAQSAA
jgi:CheY-like chemotaxis protein